MPREMLDSTTTADLPAGADLYLGYVDGREDHADSVRARFPDAKIVTVTVLGGATVADMCDCEAGDLTPSSAHRWVLARRAEGHWPTIYLEWAQWAQCRQLFVDAGELEPPWVVALYDNVADLGYGHVGNRLVDLTGIVAKQYTDSTRSGGHFDRSIVANHWPGVDRPPSQEEPTMLQTVAATKTGVTVPIGGLAGETPVAAGDRRAVTATMEGQHVWQEPGMDGHLYVFSDPDGPVDVTYA